jgi:hypothetical protein
MVERDKKSGVSFFLSSIGVKKSTAVIETPQAWFGPIDKDFAWLYCPDLLLYWRGPSTRHRYSKRRLPEYRVRHPDPDKFTPPNHFFFQCKDTLQTDLQLYKTEKQKYTNI